MASSILGINSILNVLCYAGFLKDLVNVGVHLREIGDFYNIVFTTSHNKKLWPIIVFNSNGYDFNIFILEFLGVLSIWRVLPLSFSVSDEYYDLSVVASTTAFYKQLVSFIIGFPGPGGSSCKAGFLNIGNDFVDIACQLCFDEG